MPREARSGSPANGAARSRRCHPLAGLGRNRRNQSIRPGAADHNKVAGVLEELLAARFATLYVPPAPTHCKAQNGERRTPTTTAVFSRIIVPLVETDCAGEKCSRISAGPI
jgi:hypothetical protein